MDRDFNDCILANLDFRHITTDDDTDNDTDTDEDHPAGYTTMTKIQEPAELIRSGMVNAVLRFIHTSPAKSTLLVKVLERNSAVLLEEDPVESKRVPRKYVVFGPHVGVLCPLSRRTGVRCPLPGWLPLRPSPRRGRRSGTYPHVRPSAGGSAWCSHDQEAVAMSQELLRYLLKV